MIYQCQQYRVKSALNQTDACELTRKVVGGQIEFEQVFRDNEHSFCASFRYRDRHLILKITRSRNTRIWERLLTWFRPSECFRIYASHQQLQQEAFMVPAPVLAAEKRSFGCVVHGFVVYEFLEGRIARKEHAQAVLDTLLDLHARGYVRNDPKLVNFIVNDEGIGLIDFKLAKPVLLRQLRIHLELAQFLNKYPKLEMQLPPRLGEEIWFKLAQVINASRRAVKTKRRKIKSRLKRQFRH